jgi:hypothetical protein
MYFAQEFVSLRLAMIVSAAVVLAIIGLRTMTIMGVRLALLGAVLPGAAIMALTLVAAVRPNLQGLLLTCLTIAMFILLMVLMPRLHPAQNGTGAQVAVA